MKIWVILKMVLAAYVLSQKEKLESQILVSAKKNCVL